MSHLDSSIEESQQCFHHVHLELTKNFFQNSGFQDNFQNYPENGTLSGALKHVVYNI